MATHPHASPSYINGHPATASQLNPLAFAGFAHFTAMQVRCSRVKGLDLHLDRLRNASLAFFGRAPTDELLRSYIRMAIEKGASDQSLTVTVFSPHGEFTADSMAVEPAVLVRTAAPSEGPKGPLRLSAIEHQRPLAAIKHVGEVGKTYYLHQAIRKGFDDAAFVNERGHLSEATIWNLVFWDGEAVIWPKAEMLQGTMMGMVQRQLARLEVPQRHEPIPLERLRTFCGAAVMNSWTPGIAVTAIASHTIDEARPFIELLHKAYEAEPADCP
ncbi:Branched-chain amino acid aminotransferase/4-amino-4-deoxychorismate lyase [Pseudomonas cuatrocienegasensis]|uniref:Branched-chain amino acid aminotransferase/4-amino-4-deoxychorismate lyase n=1 Tax=Pseudomonas cuatrocienegasensis TaxID=543360 RepID=A0ABY1B0A5_9PSED|nr:MULTISPECIES: aminotransferase class IV family protein [Pseudomonas]OEC36145.1 aminotransferase class IV [Pseudomonas sp. 21C1]SEP62168.1 Branched-chain amino acid aminotransferase/4-amino-4-deoxychorismate lyase [Pseudomonas cuatrocienegasensis]